MIGYRVRRGCCIFFLLLTLLTVSAAAAAPRVTIVDSAGTKYVLTDHQYVDASGLHSGVPQNADGTASFQDGVLTLGSGWCSEADETHCVKKGDDRSALYLEGAVTIRTLGDCSFHITAQDPELCYSAVSSAGTVTISADSVGTLLCSCTSTSETAYRSEGLEVKTSLTVKGGTLDVRGDAAKHSSYGLFTDQLTISGGRVTTQSGTAGISDALKVTNGAVSGGALEADGKSAGINCVIGFSQTGGSVTASGDIWGFRGEQGAYDYEQGALVLSGGTAFASAATGEVLCVSATGPCSASAASAADGSDAAPVTDFAALTSALRWVKLSAGTVSVCLVHCIYDGKPLSLTSFLTATAADGSDLSGALDAAYQYLDPNSGSWTPTTPENSGAAERGGAPCFAGTYRAQLTYSGGDYLPWTMLTEEMTVAKRSVTAADLILPDSPVTKPYDGTVSCGIETLPVRDAAFSVAVCAVYDNADAGKCKTVTLTVLPSENRNYAVPEGQTIELPGASIYYALSVCGENLGAGGEWSVSGADLSQTEPGQMSFDPATRTLTLNGVELPGEIRAEGFDLNIVLTDGSENEVSGSVCVTDGALTISGCGGLYIHADEGTALSVCRGSLILENCAEVTAEGSIGICVENGSFVIGSGVLLCVSGTETPYSGPEPDSAAPFQWQGRTLRTEPCYLEISVVENEIFVRAPFQSGTVIAAKYEKGKMIACVLLPGVGTEPVSTGFRVEAGSGWRFFLLDEGTFQPIGRALEI